MFVFAGAMAVLACAVAAVEIGWGKIKNIFVKRIAL